MALCKHERISVAEKLAQTTHGSRTSLKAFQHSESLNSSTFSNYVRGLCEIRYCIRAVEFGAHKALIIFDIERMFRYSLFAKKNVRR